MDSYVAQEARGRGGVQSSASEDPRGGGPRPLVSQSLSSPTEGLPATLVSDETFFQEAGVLKKLGAHLQVGVRSRRSSFRLGDGPGPELARGGQS